MAVIIGENSVGEEVGVLRKYLVYEDCSLSKNSFDMYLPLES